MIKRDKITGVYRYSQVKNTVMVLLILTAVTISGCDIFSNQDTSEDIIDEPGQMEVSMSLAEVESQMDTEVDRVEIALEPWGSGDAINETFTPDSSQIDETITGLEPGQWDISVDIISVDDEILGSGSQEGILIESGETAEVSIEITIWVDPDTGEVRLMVNWVFEERRLSDEEDCTSLDPDNVEVIEDSGSWQIVEGSSLILTFDSEDLANRGLEIIQSYGLTYYCFVGRPDPPMQYWLQNELAPKGDIGNEDCTSFNPDSVEVVEDGESWDINEGDLYLLTFDSEDLADEGLRLIQKYRFSEACYVGRPDAPMMYFKAN